MPEITHEALIAAASERWPNADAAELRDSITAHSADVARAALGDLKRRGAVWSADGFRAAVRRLAASTPEPDPEPGDLAAGKALIGAARLAVTDGREAGDAEHARLVAEGVIQQPDETDRRTWGQCRNPECDRGWVFVTEDHDGLPYSAVKPCDQCQTGRDRAEAKRRRRPTDWSDDRPRRAA